MPDDATTPRAVGHAPGAGAPNAHPGLTETGPDILAKTTSLGQVIRAARDQPVHVLFVHGIRQSDRGTSDIFRAGLSARARRFGIEPTPVKLEHTHRLDLGARPALTYMGAPIWPEDAAWAMGPFVDRYEYARTGGGAPVVVDEVNWWPLVLPLRCMALLAPEAELAGPDVADLRVCAALDAAGRALNDGIHYPFLAKTDLDRLIHAKPPGGGAALVNGFVKRALVDWGLSDAVIALGPMQSYLRAAIDQAFAFAADRDQRQGRAATFVVVAESLGSFIVFDAYAVQAPGVEAVMRDTANMYFFANQLALLELARLSAPTPPLHAQSAAPAVRPSLHQALARWAESGPRDSFAAPIPACKQIIAFSDPSDVLTFRVPRIDGIVVVNVHDRNGVDLLRLVADPLAAHIGHSGNPHVLDLMLS